MRTLLIDNHDSFTYNLFHYLAEVNGREPEVVVNNDPRWHPGHLAAFDNVVLSPGPGHPGRPADFGICRDVLDHGGLPTLGVCLGHQGLAALHGARVGRAPEPYHGRTSPVLHTGTDLFDGLPSPFAAVRYHSLAVDRLPAALQATAWTPDGVLMALRHRLRPLWGVQFHPESIGGEHGHRLLDNFRTLTLRHGGRHRPAPRATAPAPAVEIPRTPATPAPRRRLRVLTRTLPFHGDGETAFDRLFRRGDHPYWLDAARPDSGTGRRSVMGDASGPLGRVVRADAWDQTVTVRSAAGTVTTHGPFLDWLDRDLAALDTRVPELPFDFALGWVGYLGYGLKAECGGRPAHRSTEPDAVLVFGDRALVLDHTTGTGHLLTLVEDDAADGAGGRGACGGAAERAARQWLDEAARTLAALPRRAAPAAARPAPPRALRLRHDRTAYLGLIDSCQEEIAAGETYEVCLTNMAEADGDRDPWQDYRYLRRTSPSPLGAFLPFDGIAVLSTSPERFLRVDRHGHAESRPIKGTRPRGTTPAEDRALAADLRTSPKDRAENLMIVDLVRNDLGKCARTGSVTADDIFRVETHARAHQLVSTVRARLRADSTTVRCVRAAFPPGSMTGAPKLRTMEIIDRLENGPRGAYSGAIGYFSLTGAADLSVAIRTAVITPGRIRYGVGGAVIALSDPAEEFEETMVKAAPFLALTGDDGPATGPRAPFALGTRG
ncbi:aminodeoxychorismate synthase component I [Streptomyces yaizuensis]|uniref:aminodeoxychorismate synthase n=1 Tax=Streptomyces yaizuensis TaxID=2989713 RepID=A0ABQ5NQK2_9ACTN|nr:aminodeoxychorismate synthase component I [Streptomyces sp. YSPA8]GLF92641.1 aminodeoxychorismate synthase component I [Streptomyces sp. YSPA8]